MTTRWERALWLAAALFAAATVAAPVLPPPLAVLALAVTWGVTPGAWLARRFAAEQGSDVRAALALLASPFVCGAALALGRTAGLQATFAAQGISAVLALLAAGEALRPAPVVREATDARPGWWVAVAFGALLLLAYAVNPALMARSDGSFHAGVVWAAERALPPEDPFFAGLPLRYAWGPHAWAAGWLALAPRLSAYTPLMWANAADLVATLLAVSALARRLGGSPRTAVLAQVLALVGAAPFGWVVLAARTLRGDVRGAAELAKALEHGADGALRALDPGWIHPSLVLPLDKFVVLTPFAWALAAAVVALLAVAAFHDGRQRRSLAWLGLALAAALFAHPFAGSALVLTIVAGTVATRLVRRAGALGLGPLLAAAGAVALTLPYLLALAAPGMGDAAAGLSEGLAGELSALVGGAIVLPMAFRQLGVGPGRDAISTFTLAGLGALVVPAVLLTLAGENQSKLLNLAFLLASAPAAVGWARLPLRWRRVAIAAFAFAVGPTLAAALWAYAHEGPNSIDAPSRPPAEIIAAVRRFVPRDAIVVDATLDTTRGAAPALPGETGRAMLWSGAFLARKWGHPREALAARAEAARRFEHGVALALPLEPLAGATGEAGERRELWLLTPETAARLPDPRERLIARAAGVSLVRLPN